MGIHFEYLEPVLLVNGSLTRCVKLRVAHAPGMPEMFTPPPSSKETARHASRHVPGIPGAYTTHNFTYLVRGQWWLICVLIRFPEASISILLIMSQWRHMMSVIVIDIIITNADILSIGSGDKTSVISTAKSSFKKINLKCRLRKNGGPFVQSSMF